MYHPGNLRAAEENLTAALSMKRSLHGDGCCRSLPLLESLSRLCLLPEPQKNLCNDGPEFFEQSPKGEGNLKPECSDARLVVPWAFPFCYHFEAVQTRRRQGGTFCRFSVGSRLRIVFVSLPLHSREPPRRQESVF